MLPNFLLSQHWLSTTSANADREVLVTVPPTALFPAVVKEFMMFVDVLRKHEVKLKIVVDGHVLQGTTNPKAEEQQRRKRYVFLQLKPHQTVTLKRKALLADWQRTAQQRVGRCGQRETKRQPLASLQPPWAAHRTSSTL